MALDGTKWTVTRATGDIRYIGDDHDGTPSYATVLEFHRWLQDLQDDEEFTGDDETDIVDTEASDRSTDNIITLKGIFNIDDKSSQFLYDGSIIQGTGGTEVFYDGIVNFGNAAVQIQILQNGQLLADDWWNQNGAGLNADATSGISHRFMLKVRDGGADIDTRKLLGLARTFGNTYSEFSINATARGNNVLALTDAADLNNTTVIGTVASWTTITNTEGYRQLDADNDTVNESYYSEYNRDTFTINQLFERTKWLSRDPTVLDSADYADSAREFPVGNGTITGQAQSFKTGPNAEMITKVVLPLRKFGSPTGNATVGLYTHTGTYGSTGNPTEASGSGLITSATVDVAAVLDSAAGDYREITFNFNADSAGFAGSSNQVRLLGADSAYFVGIDFTGDASNYVTIRGDGIGTHSGNQSQYAGTWADSGAADLSLKVYTSPELYGIEGAKFRGITHELALSGGSGTWIEPEPVTWASGSGQLLAVDNTTASSATKMWIQILTGTAPSSGAITGTHSNATNTVSSNTERTLAKPYIGQSTGSALIGAYGIGVETADLASTDTLFALEDPAVAINPPNNVTFTVSGLVVGDRILVTEDDGTAINFNQFKLAGAGEPGSPVLTGNPQTTVQISDSAGYGPDEITIASDTPASGQIRLLRPDGLYSKHAYTSWTGNTFTLSTTAAGNRDFSTNSPLAGANCFVGYLDSAAASTSEAFTSVYRGSDRTMFIRVRDGGGTPIKTAQTTGTLGSGGGSATVNRLDDA